MSWSDEVESDLSLDLFKGRVRCIDCQRTFQVSEQELILVGEQGYFRCWACTQARMETRHDSR